MMSKDGNDLYGGVPILQARLPLSQHDYYSVETNSSLQIAMLLSLTFPALASTATSTTYGTVVSMTSAQALI